MPAHVVQIGKHRFVCGLFWQSLSKPRELRKEAVELGRRVKFDLMVLRKDYGIAQAGYANAGDGLRPGMYSLAAAAGKTVALEGAAVDGRRQNVHSWLGAFRLPDDRWAYFAVRDESFLPTGDFAGTREEVVERLQADYALGGWNVVFGEEELRGIGFHNFQARTIVELLPRRPNGEVKVHGWWALRTLASRRRQAVIAGAVVAAGCALTVAAYMVYQRQTPADPAGAYAAAQLGRHAARLPHPWATDALPADFARECEERLRHLAPGGWQLTGFECGSGLDTHAWKRGDSLVANLVEDVPEAVVALDGESARVSEPFNAVASKSDEPLLSAKDALNAVMTELQSLQLQATVTAVPPPPAPPPSNNPLAAPPPVQDWQAFRFSVKTAELGPEALAHALTQPGVRLTKASFNGQDWSLEGMIYAK
jgi:hypothetical protein